MSRVALGLASLAAAAGMLLGQTRDLKVETVADYQKGVKVALVVGVGAYPEDSGLAALKYPVRDAEALAAELERQGYAVRKLTDGSATRAIVRKLLNDLGQVIDANQGSFLFFFAGHGYAQDGVNYLATYGVAADDLKSDGLPIPEVEALLRKSRAKRQMLFVDACRSEPKRGARDGGSRTFADLKASEGLRALYATRAGSVSYEAEELQHGVFTHFLLQGLAGGAANPKDGLVTFRDLSDYVIAKVKSYSVTAGKVQVPFEAGESSGDFLVGRLLPGPEVVVKTDQTKPIPRPPQTDSPPPSEPVGPMRTRAGKDGLTYSYIPPGRFEMGCSPNDRGCNPNERPPHVVDLTHGFWMGQTEVTVGSYKRFARATIGEMPDSPDVNRGWKNERMPMVNVTFKDAAAYCGWSGGRLPTEAEWEFAARGGVPLRRYGELDDIAWTAENSGDTLHPVAQKQPNRYGLYDMLGSVWEWTADWFRDKYTGEPERDPRGPSEGEYRVVRGGSWYFAPSAARASDRGRSRPDNDNHDLGFRCVIE
jgi:formylglycine-generating enzyme required for sulfatase activity